MPHMLWSLKNVPYFVRQWGFIILHSKKIEVSSSCPFQGTPLLRCYNPKAQAQTTKRSTLTAMTGFGYHSLYLKVKWRGTIISTFCAQWIRKKKKRKKKKTTEDFNIDGNDWLCEFHWSRLAFGIESYFFFFENRDWIIWCLGKKKTVRSIL